MSALTLQQAIEADPTNRARAERLARIATEELSLITTRLTQQGGISVPIEVLIGVAQATTALGALYAALITTAQP